MPGVNYRLPKFPIDRVKVVHYQVVCLKRVATIVYVL